MSQGYRATRHECFITPIWHFGPDPQIDNSLLIEAIHHERETDPKGTHVSNIGGWQSNMYLFQKEAFFPLVNILMEKAIAVCSDWGLEFFGYPPVLNTLWANINRGPQTNFMHHHWGFPLQNFNILSGAYYVKCNPSSGPIKFIDERPSSKFAILTPFMKQANRFLGEWFSVRPNVGELILFPCWLEHRVAPSEDEEERISISFNFSLPIELTDKIYNRKKNTE